MKKLPLLLSVALIGALACAPTPYGELAQKHTGAFVNIHDTIDNTNGSGFVIEYQEELFIVTAAHVYESTDRPIFITMKSRSVYYAADHAARPPAIDPGKDIAVIPWEPYFDAPMVPLRISNESMSQGDSVALTCNPFQFEHPLREGVYARKGTSEDFSHLGELLRVYTYKDLDPRGCSGSAIINARGDVVGVFILYEGHDYSALWAVPIEHIVALIEQVQDNT